MWTFLVIFFAVDFYSTSIVARECTLEIIQASFIVQDMVDIDKCPMCTWKEYEFCTPVLKIAFYSLVINNYFYCNLLVESNLSALHFFSHGRNTSSLLEVLVGDHAEGHRTVQLLNGHSISLFGKERLFQLYILSFFSELCEQNIEVMLTPEMIEMEFPVLDHKDTKKEKYVCASAPSKT